MKIHYTDLLRFLTKNPTIKDLSDKLYQLGHEHEIHNDIFEMELTPNRGDCFSVYGLARDLNIFYDLNDQIDIYEKPIEELHIDFHNSSPKACPKISFLEIEIGNDVKPYKSYLDNYFKNFEINKTNFFTDISNYLSYELGQPTHCFDGKISNNCINLEQKIVNEEFTTLLGTKVDLNGENLVFSSNNKIISLAGIMGGINSACSQNTRKVLVECAFFNPEAIIGKSIKYNINSDAAHKFERGVDRNSHETVLRRFLKIVSDHAEIINTKLKSFEYSSYIENSLEIDHKKINSILGTSISEDSYLNYLSKLNFKIDESIKVPSHRHDINSQNDLSEEIARVIGYNNITDTPIKSEILKPLEPEESMDMKLKQFLINQGFTEVINFPFTSQANEKSIIIDNPLDSTKKYMRLDLKESLISNLIYNENRQFDSLKLFEISNTYHDTGYIEKESRLAIIAAGRLGQNYNEFTKKIDKKFLERIFSPLELLFEEIPRKHLDTKNKNKIFYAEINLNQIPNLFYKNAKTNIQKFNFIKYKKISEFPSSYRDLSFSIKSLDQVNGVIDYFEKIKFKTLKKVFMFDFYKNKSNNEIKIGYRFIFQAEDKTLTEREINSYLNTIIEPILKKEGIHIPGM